jgi:hypothetical protein
LYCGTIVLMALFIFPFWKAALLYFQWVWKLIVLELILKSRLCFCSMLLNTLHAELEPKLDLHTE